MCGWQVKLCYPLNCYIRAIAERFRDKGLIIKRYIYSSVDLLYFTLGWAKTGLFKKFINAVYDDVGRRSIYQNV